MYDTQMNRMSSRVTFGRDYSGPAPEMTPCPKDGPASTTGPTFAFPAPRRRRRWHR